MTCQRTTGAWWSGYAPLPPSLNKQPVLSLGHTASLELVHGAAAVGDGGMMFQQNQLFGTILTVCLLCVRS